MVDRIIELLSDRGVNIAAPISLKNCIITRKYKLDQAGFSETDDLTAIIFAVPYLTEHKRKNLSAYAVPRDYHIYFDGLFKDIVGKLEIEFPRYSFVGFADNSPIDERDAAAKAGLGIIGYNGMLITEKHSSYVFLGEIITDIPYDGRAQEIERCENCGACKNACPIAEIGECLSALTQKKGELTKKEIADIEKHGSVWGCDICQEVCPHTLRAIKDGTIYTDIDFFKKDTVTFLTSDILGKMTDEEFDKRAYSWRGKNTIGRNIHIFEKKNRD